jgi:D-alanine-D-alanine ligase
VNDAEARQAEATALAAWHALDCRDGGRVDLRSDANGIPNFIEVNPLAGLHPEHSDLCIIAGKYGISYQELLSEIIAAAIARLEITP